MATLEIVVSAVHLRWMKKAVMPAVLILLAGCTQSVRAPIDQLAPADQPPVITGFSANHVTIRHGTWPGAVANSYCRLFGKSELLISRKEDGTFHFACLVMDETGEGEIGPLLL
jgi:hypothetical protein